MNFGVGSTIIIDGKSDVNGGCFHAINDIFL